MGANFILTSNQHFGMHQTMLIKMLFSRVTANFIQQKSFGQK
jgi:hypothetical protein